MRINTLYRIKAGALQYVIFVSLLIAILLATFFTLTYIQQQFKLNTNFYKEAVFNADQGFISIASANRIYESPQFILRDEEKGNEVRYVRSRWGIFDKISLSSRVKNNSFHKTGLLGGWGSPQFALYLKDVNKPLVLVGNTKIQGTAFLPNKQVKRGTIGGRSFEGNQLVFGDIKKSNDKLPRISDKSYIRQLCSGEIDIKNTKLLDLDQKKVDVFSFTAPTYVIDQQRAILLSDVKLIGNVIIRSKISITVNKSAFLNDVILIAPSIKITDNVKGNFQAFASEKIEIGSGCILEYPTVIMLYSELKKTESKNKNDVTLLIPIVVGRDSEIRGSIGFFDVQEKINFRAQIFLEEGVQIYGEVYCEKNLELKGTVNGAVITSGFVAAEFGSVYQNHIYNGRILYGNLTHKFVGLYKSEETSKVVKWLY